MTFFDKNQGIIKLCFLLLLLSSLLLGTPHEAQAAFCLSASGCLQEFMSQAMTLFAFIIEQAGRLLDFVLGLSSFFPSSLNDAWSALLNFVNLFFILFLIIIAFGTIMNSKNYSASALLPRLIVMALLVNFSFAFAKYIIILANGLAHVFINTIGSVSVTYADKMGAGKIIAGDPLTTLTGSISQMFFQVIFTAITALAMMAAAIFALIRIPILWALLVLSPIAWVGSIIPAIKKHTWDKWWSWFVSWTLFAPVYLFFLMIGSIVLNSKTSVGAGGGDLINADVRTTLQGFQYVFGGVLNLYDIIFYLMALFIMLGGLFVSFKLSMFAGNGAGAAMKWAQERVKRLPMPVPGGNIAALQSQAKAGFERVQKEGLGGRFGALYGGEAAQKQREGAAADWMSRRVTGLPSRGEADSAQAQNIEAQKKNLQGLSQVELEARMKGTRISGGAKGSELMAIYQLRAERGWVKDQNEIDAALSAMGNDTAATEKYVEMLGKGGFENAYGGNAQAQLAHADNTTNKTLKRALYKNLADDKRFDGSNLDAVARAIDAFKDQAKSDKDGLLKSLEKNLDNIIDANQKLAFGRGFAGTGPGSNLEFHRMVMRNVAKNRQAQTETVINDIRTAFNGQSQEDIEAVEKELQKNIVNIAKDKDARVGLMKSDTSSALIKKLAARELKAKEEIDNNKDYRMAFDALGGDTSPEARELLDAVAKENKFAATEIKIRDKFGLPTEKLEDITDPAVNAELQNEFMKGVDRMPHQDIIGAKMDQWKLAPFQDAVVNKAKALENLRPTIPREVVKVPYKQKDGTIGYKEVVMKERPGKGKEFLQNLEKMADSKEKLEIVRGIAIGLGY